EPAERVGEVERVDLSPAPVLWVRAEAVLEVVERAPQGLERELVPGTVDQDVVALLPESEQVAVPAPGRGDVGDEAVVRAVEVALGEVAVADRGTGELSRQAKHERLVDGPGDRLRPERPIPALQPLERSDLPLAGRLEPGEQLNDLIPGDRV